MGKSHLVAHFIRQVSDTQARVVVGVCQSVTRSAPYIPWRQIFNSLLDLEDSSEDEAIDRLTSYLQKDGPRLGAAPASSR